MGLFAPIIAFFRTASPRLVNVALVTSLVFGCKAPSDSQSQLQSRSSYGPYSKSQAARLRWSEAQIQTGLTVKVGSNLATDFAIPNSPNAFELAKNAWNNANLGVQFFKASPSTEAKNYTKLVSFHDNEMGVYKKTNWFPEVGSQALAITQFFGKRKTDGRGEYVEMVHADIILNFEDYEFSTDPDDFTKYDIASVLTHELGHFLGLHHELNSYSSVMRPSLGTFESERELYPLDIDSLLMNYPELNQENGNSHLTAGSTNAANSGIYAGHISDGSDEWIEGHFELRADGECAHYVGKNYIQSHYLSIKRPLK